MDTTDAGKTPKKFKLPSTLGYALGSILLFGLAGFCGGIVLTLFYLELGTFDLVILLSILALLCTAGVALFLEFARTRQNAAIAAMEQQTRQAYDILDTQRTEQAKIITAQSTQIQILEAQIETLAQHESQLAVPIILGWQNLGQNESEIAPQVAIFAELFRGQHQVHIQKKLHGGYRNRGVYRTRSSAEADRIVKIARSADIRAERQAQELFNRFSQNNGGQYVREVHSPDNDAPGGIVYRLASLNHNANLQSLETFYRDTLAPEVCAGLIETLFSKALPHSEFRTRSEIALIQAYTLPEHVLRRVTRALIEIPALAHIVNDAETSAISFGNQTLRIRNPLRWAETVMQEYCELSAPIMCGVIHGDLHSGNILLEIPEQHLWLIDFAKTRAEAHTLADYARMETDIQFHLLQHEPGEDYFTQALRLEELLLTPHTASELAPLPDAFRAFDDKYQKAGACIAALRRVATYHHRESEAEPDGHFIGAAVLPYYVALWHTTMRTLMYTQCSDTQKTYALVTAGMLSERITQLLS